MIFKQRKVKHLLITSALFSAFISHAVFADQTSNSESNQSKVFCEAQRCDAQMKKLRKYARWGDPKSQYVMATAYYKGEGVEKDVEKAIFWLKRTAFKGFDRKSIFANKAMSILENMYRYGIDVPVDIEEADKLMAIMLKRNYTPAMYKQSLNLLKENKVDEGIQLLKEASSSGNIASTYLLASMYRSGEYLPQDIKLAATHFKKIVSRDYKDSRKQLTSIIKYYESGESSSSATNNPPQVKSDFVDDLTASLDIEVITVNPTYTGEIEPLAAMLNDLRTKDFSSAGTRIKGKKCGQGASNCAVLSMKSLDEMQMGSGAQNVVGPEF
ncbi:tetratricopeptide repeat protein [Colwelliaceae bacterium 6441]